MELAPMRYKDFVWPHNPYTYTIEYERVMGNQKVPFGRYHLQDMGLTRRVMKGEGEFIGEDAYDRFKALATVFYSGGPGALIHPVWQASNAYFVELSLRQAPRRDYVRYTFTFWESYDEYQGRTGLTEEKEGTGGTAGNISRTASGTGAGTAATTTAGGTGELWHRVRKGESLWKIARDYGAELTAVIALNPQIKNPNLIYVGQEVRIK